MSDRGRVVTIELSRLLQLNGKTIRRAIIELDHINYGLDSKTKTLNKKRRSQFSVKDVEKFIMELDGEDIAPTNRNKTISYFDIRINCPIVRNFYQEEFLMFFDLDSRKPDEIHVITMFRSRR